MSPLTARLAGNEPVSGYPTDAELATLSPAGIMERLKLLAHSQGTYRVVMYPANGDQPVTGGRFRRAREARIYRNAWAAQTGCLVEIQWRGRIIG